MKKELIILLFLGVILTMSAQTTPVLLKNINPNDGDVPFFWGSYSEITTYGDKIYFKAHTGDSDFDYELHASDGTTNGTHLVFSQQEMATDPMNITGAGELVYFVGNAPFIPEELWATDGTEEGTYLVKDIKPNSSSSPKNLMAYNDKLYFWADDGVYGHELWTSDGTETGTFMVKDINPYHGSMTHSEYFDEHPPVIYNDLIYFTVDDGYGLKLWVSDGTEVGTHVFYNVNANELTIYNDKLYFSGKIGANEGLWVTDGTLTGTYMIMGFNDGVQDLFVCNGSLYFYASYSELWVTDGTEEATHMVKDINSTSINGQSYWYPQQRPMGYVRPFMAELDGKLYFTANDGIHGPELWVTDGTEEGTNLVIDITEGNESGAPCNYCGPYNLTVLDDKLYFTTTNEEYGHQLWVTEGTAETTQIILPENPNFDALRFTDKLQVFNNNLYFPAYYHDYIDNVYIGPSIYVIGDNNVSIEEIFQNSKVKLYPNPSADILYFSEELEDVQVYSILGKLVLSENKKDNIDISSLGKGLYIIKAKESSGRSFSSKFTKL